MSGALPSPADGGGRQSPNHDGRAVISWPDASTVLLDRTQSPRLPVVTASRIGPPGPDISIEVRLSAIVTGCRAGGRRCGRTHSGTATWTRVKTARVTAMAGRV